MHPIITTYYGVTFNNTHLYYGVLAAMLAVHRSAAQRSAVQYTAVLPLQMRGT